MMGINGKILRVNLSNRSIKIETPSETEYRTCFGGRGFVAYHLLKELPAGIDPLGPENKLIFATGPITGAPVAGSGRNSVGAKSPLTGGYGDSEAGGFWGVELKKAGYDAIIIEGQADKPVYLWIHDGEVEIRDASSIWGMKTADVEEKLKSELGDKRIRICQIGIAGEKLIPYACITNDLTHFAGRTGLGAVMGSKKLKAIAVRGNKTLEYSDREKLSELGKWMSKKYMDLAGHLYDRGTGNVLLPLNIAGGLPTRNFREGVFEGAEKISGETIRDTILIKRENCYACPIRCKRVVETKEPYKVDPRYGGPEYETLGSLGSLCGIDNLEAICKGNELCNAYGLDTISTGVSIAFAMECFEKGILTTQDTGGMALNFGNAEAMLTLIEQIVNRSGLGKILAQGVKKAADQIGNGAEELAMHVKGQEIPMHEPRLKFGLGLGYAVSPTGADHCHNIHDTYFTNNVDSVKPLGVLEPMALSDLSSKKVRLTTYFINWRHFGNCAVYCYFVPWSFQQIVEMVEAITGWKTSLWEILKIGERANTLTRAFNIREGFTSDDDRLKSRFSQPLPSGPLKGVKIKPEDLEYALKLYYGMMGWDNNGKPTLGKLEELGIGWVSDLW